MKQYKISTRTGIETVRGYNEPVKRYYAARSDRPGEIETGHADEIYLLGHHRYTVNSVVRYYWRCLQRQMRLIGEYLHIIKRSQSLHDLFNK